jgi:hypothetical protein
MKRHIRYLAVLLSTFIPWMHASQAIAVPPGASHLLSDCTQRSDNKVVDAATSLHVAVVSCSGRLRIVVDRKASGVSAETESREFNIPSTGVNEVVAVSKDAFDVNLMQAMSYANPSIMIYHFHFRRNQWLLEEMSFQATHSCNGEAGVDADYYDVDYRSGKVEMKMYEGCDHFQGKHVVIKPASIFLEDFDPADERLTPFQYE